MTKNELIALTNQVRELIEKLRTEMTCAIDSASETDNDVYNIPYEEDCECNSAFIDLCNALGDFAKLLEGKKDLPLDALVMCKRTASELVGWRVEYYVERGATKPDIISDERRDDWLYIVPLKYFRPDAPDWTPEDKFNWANFGEGEK